MTTFKINKLRDQTFELPGDGDTLIVKKAGTIATHDVGISDQAGDGNTIIVDGQVFGTIDGIFASQTTSSEIKINETGKVSSDQSAIAISGNDASVVNLGLIQGTVAGGIYDFSDHGLHVSNSGKIKGSIYSQAIGTDVVNEKGGIILGGSNFAAIVYNIGAVGVDAPHATVTINHGTIADEPGGVSFLGADGDDRLVNDGTMRGDVVLRTGNDAFNTQGGTVLGKISGGAGNDSFITGDAHYHMLEHSDEGYDTVKSTVSYRLNTNVEALELLGHKNVSGTGNPDRNDIFGNSSDNTLRGEGGADSLDGRRGNDLLVGGADNDRFVFATGDGHDVIADFENDSSLLSGDRIDLGGWSGIDSFADVKKHLTVHGADLMITFGNDSLTILGVAKSDLDATDFAFGGPA